jgi:carbamoyl-phosphate synthase large subunit
MRSDQAVRVEVVLSTVSEEMLVLSGREDEIADAGAAIWLSPRERRDASTSGVRLGTVRRRIPPPATAWGPHGSTCPDRGSKALRARITRTCTPSMIARSCSGRRAAVDPIVQTRLSGREFTVDVVIDRTGEVAGAILLAARNKRASVPRAARSSSRKSRRLPPELSSLGLQAAVNVQGFVSNDGAVSIVEVNPRRVACRSRRPPGLMWSASSCEERVASRLTLITCSSGPASR